MRCAPSHGSCANTGRLWTHWLKAFLGCVVFLCRRRVACPAVLLRIGRGYSNLYLIRFRFYSSSGEKKSATGCTLVVAALYLVDHACTSQVEPRVLLGRLLNCKLRPAYIRPETLASADVRRLTFRVTRMSREGSVLCRIGCLLQRNIERQTYGQCCVLSIYLSIYI